MNTHKSPARFNVDFTKKQIVATKATLRAASRSGSAEYKELCELLEAHPKFEVVEKKIKKSNSKKSYHGLNIRFIESYISIQSNADLIMAEYEGIKDFAKQQGYSIYPYVKKWFLRKFPDFDMDKAKAEITNAEYAAARSVEAA